jgi:nucleoredoxin
MRVLLVTFLLVASVCRAICGPVPLTAKEIGLMLRSGYSSEAVYWRQGTLSHFDDEALENKKLYLFFFSANWSPQGRKFTPQLVEYYNRIAPQHPEFEVIFFSADRSPFGMETYMGQANMPWPAVDYEKLGSKAAIQNNFVRGLPCLILVDGTGKVLSNSYGTEKNLGPETVLADLDKILSGKSESAVAQRP